jgi:5-methyltetrahydropteroyltriglutamate--homocysteine methyltransferase
VHRRAGKVARARAYSSPWPLESQQDLLRRIDEAGKYVPVANLALSPQCGFASVVGGNEISWDDQRRKLDLLVDTARKVWGE